jgi:hypothetical protein
MALTLVTSTVNPSADNAYLDDWIVLEFDQNIDPLTVTSNTVTLYLLPNYNPYSIKTEVTNNILKVKGSPSLLGRNSSYELLVVSGATGVKSATAQQLTENKIIAFQTKELLAPSVPAPDPQVVVQQYSNIQEQIGDPVAILVPDVNIQGEIMPFKPCPPGGFGDVTVPIFESGIPVTVSGSSLLKSITSDPDPYSVGVTDLTTITIYWEEAIELVVSTGVVELSYEDLNYPINAFSKTQVVIDNVSAVGNQLIISASGFPTNLTNLEFTLIIKPLKIQSLDGLKKNGLERYYWLGVLDPLLCTIDMAKANAGLWTDEFSLKDIYYYIKLMYIHSVSVLRGSGYSDVNSVPDDVLVSMSKFVCCSTALDMITNGSSISGSSSGSSRSGIFVKKRVLPGVTVEYGTLSSTASSAKDIADPAKESLKRLLDCINTNKPKDQRTLDKGPLGITTGVKSLYDTSTSIPYRRRL